MNVGVPTPSGPSAAWPRVPLLRLSAKRSPLLPRHEGLREGSEAGTQGKAREAGTAPEQGQWVAGTELSAVSVPPQPARSRPAGQAQPGIQL